MKHLYFFKYNSTLKLLGFLLLSMNYSGFVFASCPGSAILTTQADVDNFSTTYSGCTVFPYDIYISGSGITNLNGLSQLTGIDGYLDIENTAITSFNGLNNLTYVGSYSYTGGYFYVYGNQNLINFSGLNKLASIQGDYFWIENNQALTSFAGLEALNSIPNGYLEIINNDALISLKAFCGLVTLGGTDAPSSSSCYYGSLDIIGNASLTSLSGLDHISGFTNDITIINNESLSICNIESLCQEIANQNVGINVFNNTGACDDYTAIGNACADGAILSTCEAQCPLSCISKVNASMPSTICARTFTAEDFLLHTAGCSSSGFQVNISYPFGTNKLEGNNVDRSHLGYLMIYSVKDNASGNSCWGYLTVEDKSGPAAPCKSAVISCFQLEQINKITNETVDACSDQNSKVILNLRFEDYGCTDPKYLGRAIRDIVGTDAWGNISHCNDTLTIKKDILDSVCCPSTLFLPCKMYCLNGFKLLNDYLHNSFGSTSLLDLKYWDQVQLSSDKKSPFYPTPELLIQIQGRNDPFVRLANLGGRPIGTKFLLQDLIIPGTIDSMLNLSTTNYCIPVDSLVVPEIKDSVLDLNRTIEYLVEDTVNNTFSVEQAPNPRFCKLKPGKTAMYPSLGGACKLNVTYTDELLPACGSGFKIRRQWRIYDWCTGSEKICVQYIAVEDKQDPTPVISGIPNSPGPQTSIVTGLKDTVYYLRTVNPHDCNAKFNINPLNVWDCSDVKESYTFIYKDPSNASKIIALNKDLGSSGASITLPVGIYIGKINLVDACYNTCNFPVVALVQDATPPNPVCDETTQATVDPATCWARVYAKDLDNGSKDNCCNVLHYAVARMDTLEYYRKVYTDHFIKVCGTTEYNNHRSEYDFLVNELLSIYVFADYIDLTECGTNQVVLRVFEACNIARYDPHVTFLSEHKWDMAQVYGLYFIFQNLPFGSNQPLDPDLILLRLVEKQLLPSAAQIVDSLKKNVVTPDDCDNLMALRVLAKLRTAIRQFGPGLLPLDDTNPNFKIVIDLFDPLLNGNISDFCIPEFKISINITQDQFMQELDAATAGNSSGFVQWALSLCQSIYSDCMVNVVVDDKTPPVCEKPTDLTFYCDNIVSEDPDDDEYEFARNACSISTLGISYNYTNYSCTDYNQNPYNQVECVKENDADASDTLDGVGKTFGWYGCNIYGAASHVDEHGAPVPACPIAGPRERMDQSESYNGAHSWIPIYCHTWLCLDATDQGGKINPGTYFYTPVLRSGGRGKDLPAGSKQFIIWDNCWLNESSLTQKDASYFDQCGNGWIQRTWTVNDKCGLPVTCSQKIITKHRSDFEVMFPSDVKTTCDSDSNLSPTATGRPMVMDDECELVGVNYVDQRFDIVPDACYKIVRTWTLVDWCKYDPNQRERDPEVIIDDRAVADPISRFCIYRKLKDDGDGYMTYTQIIKVVDTIAPAISCTSDTFCINDGYSGKGDEPTPMCTVPSGYRKTFTAHDNCTSDNLLAYRYEIYKGSSLVRKTGPNQGSSYLAIANDLTPGLNTIVAIVSDKCGQEDTATCTVLVKDCKKPTPYCYNGIATVIMPTSGSITVWAKDLDAGSYDNCTVKSNLVVSFDKEGTALSRTFTCDSIPDGVAATKPVNIYVKDEAGNVDFCSTYLLIQDGSGNKCPDKAGLAANVGGKVVTEVNDPIEHASVELKTSIPMPLYNTDERGSFAFNGLPINSDIILTPSLDADPMNGISTVDLVLIQKHLLGTELITSPYKLIAADVDKSNDINSIDLVELRKLILTIYDKMPNTPSWRFIPKSYVFPDAGSPWGFPEQVEIKGLSKDEMNNDFIGIKIGDVNGTVVSHHLLGAEIRSEGTPLVFRTQDRQLNAGEEAFIEFTADNFNQIEGYQFSMAANGLEIKEVKPGLLKISEGNFGLTHISQGYLTTSWNQSQSGAGVKALANDLLFSLKVKATKPLKLSDVLFINSKYTRAEAYNGVNTLGVTLTVGNKTDLGYALNQNTPNPFKTYSLISYSLPRAERATIKITNVTGRVIRTYTQDGIKGTNELKLNRNDLAAGSGVMYYTLETKNFSATKKLVIVD